MAVSVSSHAHILSSIGGFQKTQSYNFHLNFQLSAQNTRLNNVDDTYKYILNANCQVDKEYFIEIINSSHDLSANNNNNKDSSNRREKKWYQLYAIILRQNGGAAAMNRANKTWRKNKQSFRLC